jgi:hypothetical protein
MGTAHVFHSHQPGICPNICLIALVPVLNARVCTKSMLVSCTVKWEGQSVRYSYSYVRVRTQYWGTGGREVPTHDRVLTEINRKSHGSFPRSLSPHFCLWDLVDPCQLGRQQRGTQFPSTRVISPIQTSVSGWFLPYSTRYWSAILQSTSTIAPAPAHRHFRFSSPKKARPRKRVGHLQSRRKPSCLVWCGRQTRFSVPVL